MHNLLPIALAVISIIVMLVYFVMYSIVYTRRIKRQRDKAEMKRHLNRGYSNYDMET